MSNSTPLSSAAADVTRLLEAATGGDPNAAVELLPLVYDELRRLAAHRLASERRDADEMEIPAPAPDDELLAMNEALARFAGVDPRKAELVKLRYFVGLTYEEAAEVLSIAVPTAKQWWAYARAWLRVEMGL